MRSKEEFLNWHKASSAVVAAFLPLMFALVPVRGFPVALHKLIGIAWLGMRKPAVVRPPVAISGKSSDLSKTIVSGPGQ